MPGCKFRTVKWINSYYISIKSGCYNDTKQENMMCCCSEKRIHPMRCFLMNEMNGNRNGIAEGVKSDSCRQKYHTLPVTKGAATIAGLLFTPCPATRFAMHRNHAFA